MHITRTDTYQHQGLRKNLADLIRIKGIKDPMVLAAIESVPRHFFFDSSFLNFAYEDKPFPIGAGQTISQPYTVAFQSELLCIKPGDKVLEIGTGSGYQASILAEMGAKVYSIERQRTLYQKSKKLLAEMGYTVKVFFGDGYKGLPAFAPFDKVIITAAAPYLPTTLTDQLKPGGILVAPLGSGDSQIMTTVIKNTLGKLETFQHGNFRFVPMLEDKADDK